MFHSSFCFVELLHPRGAATRVRVLGENLSDLVRSEPPPHSRRLVDAILLAPSVAECRAAGWLERAAAAAVEQLAEDGIVYCMAPPLWRTRVARVLRQFGLIAEPPVAHFPDCTQNCFLVPLQRAPARYAVNSVIPLAPWKRWVALLAFSLPGGTALLAAALPWVGFAAHRVGSIRLQSGYFGSTARCADPEA